MTIKNWPATGLLASLLLCLNACHSSSAPVKSAPAAFKADCTTPDPLPAHPLNILPVLSYATARGSLIRCPAPAQTPSAKVVDGDPSDWIGELQRFGGSTRLSAGELIYNDYLFDAYGADDGVDATRVQRLDTLAGLDERLLRADALSQALGDQLGVPSPLGADDVYGNSVSLEDEADLHELRWAADADRVYLLARYTTLTDPAKAALVILLDTAEGGGGDIGFGSGLSSSRYEHAILLTADGARLRTLASGEETALDDAELAITADGWTNALEASLPAALFGKTVKVGAFTARRTEDDGVVAANVAYRPGEPVTIYFERLQALSLHAGSIDDFGTALDLAALRAGASEAVSPGAGYHERQFASGDNISIEGGERGRWQPYGLYVPSALAQAPGLTPINFWLHYRGGKAHSGASWTPRLIDQIGERPAHLVATPRGRGTSTWYVSQAHQDFFEVYADVHALFPNIDPDRRYLSGYSMGGYGTYLFGGLYPDLFAAGYSTSGAVTQGAWTGLGPDDFTCDLSGGEIPGVGPASSPCFVEANEGDANAQLTYRVLENTRHFPITIHHGSNDELALTPGALRMGARLLALGYRHDMTIFAGYEHFTQAIVDEWADGAAYLQQFARPARPRELTYKVVPALVNAVNTQRNGDGFVFNFNPDGAWWVDDLVVRDEDGTPDIEDPSAFGMIEAESFALPGSTVLPLPRSVEVRPDEPAVSTPVLSPGAHSTPFVRTGLDWIALGEKPLSNGFAATLTRLSRATLDLAGMGLDTAATADGSITTDGAVELRLRNAGRPLRVTVNGSEVAVTGDEPVLQLDAGTHALTLQPR